jgi:hypothetical protein
MTRTVDGLTLPARSAWKDYTAAHPGTPGTECEAAILVGWPTPVYEDTMPEEEIDRIARLVHLVVSAEEYNETGDMWVGELISGLGRMDGIYPEVPPIGYTGIAELLRRVDDPDAWTRAAVLDVFNGLRFDGSPTIEDGFVPRDRREEYLDVMLEAATGGSSIYPKKLLPGSTGAKIAKAFLNELLDGMAKFKEEQGMLTRILRPTGTLNLMKDYYEMLLWQLDAAEQGNPEYVTGWLARYEEIGRKTQKVSRRLGR